MSKDAPRMKGTRSRNEDGELRRKRGDTQVGAIEKKYHRNFGVRSDMEQENLLRERGAKSLNELLREK